MKFLLGKKIEMSQVFKQGKVVPITLIEAGPCFITQVKTKEKDGYSAVQLGFKEKKPKKIKKTEKNSPYYYLKEWRISDTEEEKKEKFKKGEKLNLSLFNEGEKIKVSAISKGKGFQGGVKRWGFSGRDATHGVKHEHRTVGSVGASGPGRVFKGKRMPGRTGFTRTTIKNLEIIKIDSENNLLALKGAIPGRRGTLVEISN